MKVAFTTSKGTVVDSNFRKVDSFSIWDIGPHESYYVTTVFIKDDANDEDDKIAARAEAVKGCAIVCTKQINGPATAKLVTRNIHPMKTGEDVSVSGIIEKLQDVLKGAPAPWIRKAHMKDRYGYDY
jgi:nitrogen fixation protein NifX